MKFTDSLRSTEKKTDILGVVLPGFIIVIWYMVTADGRVPSYLLPSPLQLCQVAVDFALGNMQLTPYSGTLWKHIFESALRVFRGFALAAAIALPLGLLTGRIETFKKIIDPSVQLIKSIPGIGWLPLAMIWFGVGEKTTLFLIALAAFFPIYINTAQGVSSVSPLYLRVGKMLGASKISLVTTVIIPASLNSLEAGLRLGLGISWAYLVLGELTGVSSGLGAVMMDARMLGHVDMVMVAMILIAILGWLSDKILIALFLLFKSRIGGVQI